MLQLKVAPGTPQPAWGQLRCQRMSAARWSVDHLRVETGRSFSRQGSEQQQVGTMEEDLCLQPKSIPDFTEH